MKKLFLLLIISSFYGRAQYFSGEIVYSVKIISKSDTLNLEELIDLKNRTVLTYVITENRYKSTYIIDGVYNYSYTYDNQSKRMYDDYADKPYITYRDSRRANGKYSSSKIYQDSTTTVLNHPCYMVITESDYGKSKTYYSNDIRVNSEDFKDHKVGNWYNKLKEVNGAITLKTITEFKTHFEIQEAVSINERKVTTAEFELPKKPVAASYSALDEEAELVYPSEKQSKCYQLKVDAASKPNADKYITYITFLLSKNGEISFIDAYEKDENEFYKIGVDIINNCGFEFKPGKINGEPVDSQVFVPIVFNQ